MKQTKKWPVLFSVFSLLVFTILSEPASANSIPTTSALDAFPDWSISICKSPGQWGNTTTTPLIVGDSIYVACDNYLYKLEKATGKKEAEIELAENINYSYSLTYGDRMIFVPVNNGRVQAISTETDKSLWVSESFDGFQSNSPVTYENGKLYHAIAKDSYDLETWAYLGSEGYIYCLDTTDKDPAEPLEEKKVDWKSDLDQEGHYWARPSIYNNLLLIGTDASTITILDKTDGTKKSSIPVGGAVRSGILKDPDSSYFYVAANSAVLYRFQLNSDGTYQELTSLDLTPPGVDSNTKNCTSTPVLLNGMIYLFHSYTNSAAETAGLASVVTTDMKIIRQFKLNRSFSQSTALVIPAKNGAEIYFTQNSNPSGIYHFKDTDSTTSIDTIFEPSENLQQFCCGSVVSDENGTLFYSNDSGSVFSIGKKSELMPTISATPPITSPSPGTVPHNTPPRPTGIAPHNTPPRPTGAASSIRKPSKVKKLSVKKAGKKVMITWKKVSGKVKYQIMVKKGNKKFSPLSVTSKTTWKATLKKGTYQIKVRAFKTINKKKHYGAYSSVQKIILKVKK